MSTGTIVWLVVLIALGVLFVLTLRRMSKLVGRTRDLERYQKTVAILEQRLALTADPFVDQLDGIRRRAGDPHALSEAVAATQDTLRAIAAEGRAARPPSGLATEAAAFTVELERAVRAAELVGHGLDALLGGRGGRELEAQTSLKRGALNLRHAREAATTAAAVIARIRPGDLSGRGDRLPPAGTPMGGATYIIDGDLDGEVR